MTKLLANVLILFFLGFSAYAQRTISGVVKGENDVIGLQGVSIQLDGQTLGTTDFEGAFIVNVPEGTVSLSFVLDGFQTYTLDVSDGSQIEIVMSKSVGGGSDNTVSVGYGSQSKESNTSSVSKIDNESLGNQPVVSLEQANQGRASGLLVQNTGGELGAGTSVRIRGGSSLTSSNQPLYVVDGVPLTSGNQSNLNPQNIESIEVLKDASAAALYGSRAANGVILVTTKSGSSGKMKIDFDYQFGIHQTPKMLDVMDTAEYKILTIELFLRQFGQDDIITRENLEAWQRNGTTVFGPSNLDLSQFLGRFQYDTDWQEEIFRTGLSNRANLSLSGGSDAFNYYSSISYLNQEGIQIGNDFERLNAQLNLGSQLSSKLKTNLRLTLGRTVNNRLNEDNDLGNPIQAIVLAPSDSYDPNDNFNLLVQSDFYNPLTEINFSDYIETGNLMVGNLGLTYDFSKNLTFNVDAGIDFLDQRTERRQGPETLDGRPTGFTQITDVDVFNYLFTGYLNYNRQINDDNTFSFMLGTSFQDSETLIDFKSARRNSVTEVENLPEDSDELLNNPITGNASRFLSYFSRVNYNYQDKYVLQLAGRMDASSKFGEDNRYGFFPAVSAGWNISNESFLSGNSVISFLKLKGSYGLIGNTPDGDFLYRANYFLVKYGEDFGTRLENLENQSLKWETTTQIDVGLEFGIIGSKLSGSINYYQKDTEDLLFPSPISQITGLSSTIRNIGSMTNKGFEFNLSSVNVSNSQFSWVTDLNISNNTNEVTSLAGDTLIAGVNVFMEGEAVGAFFLPEFVGVDPLTGEAQYSVINEFTGLEETTTDYDQAVRNGRKILGNPNPELFGGITNTLSYKNFQLSFLFQFVLGVDVYNQTGEFFANSGIGTLGQRADQADRWYAPGDEAQFPVAPSLSEGNTKPSSRWLEDGSYIRLNSLTFTYQFPQKFLDKLKLRNMSIFVGGQNLFTVTDYLGYDPDVNSVDPGAGTLGQNILRGIDNFTAPQPRTYTTGIKIGL